MPRPRKDGKYVNLYARKDLMERLDEYSEKTMIPKTAVLEKALEEYLNRVVPEADTGSAEGYEYEH